VDVLVGVDPEDDLLHIGVGVAVQFVVLHAGRRVFVS
jgi:hypothetical protein